MFKILACVLVFFVFCLGMDFLIEGKNFFMYQFWAPKYANVEREVYQNTKSYRQGSTQRLNTLCVQAATTDADHKQLIYDVIDHEFAEFDPQDLPTYLMSCLTKARGQ